MARMLFLHLPARHPNTFPEIELSPHVQVGLPQPAALCVVAMPVALPVCEAATYNTQHPRLCSNHR